MRLHKARYTRQVGLVGCSATTSRPLLVLEAQQEAGIYKECCAKHDHNLLALRAEQLAVTMLRLQGKRELVSMRALARHVPTFLAACAGKPAVTMDVIEGKGELVSLLEAEKSRRRLLEQRFSNAQQEADKLR